MIAPKKKLFAAYDVMVANVRRARVFAEVVARKEVGIEIPSENGS